MKISHHYALGKNNHHPKYSKASFLKLGDNLHIMFGFVPRLKKSLFRSRQHSKLQKYSGSNFFYLVHLIVYLKKLYKLTAKRNEEMKYSILAHA